MQKGELIGRGRTAEVYRWGDEHILKLYQAHMPGMVVEREYRITQAAHAAGLPVPAAEQMVEVDGRPGIVFERIHGTSMLAELSARPWRMVAMARQLADLHAQVHACNLPPGLPTQREQILYGIQMGNELPERIQAAARECLLQLPEGRCLCHGDFHPDNILITANGPVMIDWMTGTRGHPLADVCRTAMLFQTGELPAGAPAHMRVLISLTRSLIGNTYVNRSLHLHGTTRQQMQAWQLPLMVARLREVAQYPVEKRRLLAKIEAALAPTGPA